MAIKSWYEEYRYSKTGAELEQERQQALACEANWRADDEREYLEEDIMMNYADVLMEKELKAFGNYVIKKYPGKDNKWLIADIVYNQYGHYYMLANQPAEAIKWFLKALKDKIPYPYKVWQDLAAAYVETGDYQKADYWIKRYTKHYRSENKISKSDWMDFARFYLNIRKYERALSLMKEVYPDDNWHFFDLPYVARAHFGIGQVAKGFEIYEGYFAKAQNDEAALADLALAYFNYKMDVQRAEELYLKSMKAAAKRKDARDWNRQIYENLSIIFANTANWDKCFHYLRLHFLHKFEGAEAEMFCQIIDTRPPIEDDEMGGAIYQAIIDFEKSPVRPGGLQLTDGLAPESPAEEVDNSLEERNDLSSLFDWDDAISN